jgi:hypothetical protein
MNESQPEDLREQIVATQNPDVMPRTLVLYNLTAPDYVISPCSDLIPDRETKEMSLVMEAPWASTPCFVRHQSSLGRGDHHDHRTMTIRFLITSRILDI